MPHSSLPTILRILLPLILLAAFLLPQPAYAGEDLPGGGNTVFIPVIFNSTPPTWLGPYGGSVVALTRHPTNSNIVYAGTWGAGVFKSIDGGKTWQASNSGMGRQQINSLAVDPIDPNILFAGTYGNGIYKTVNAGATWTLASNGIEANRVTYAIAVSPGDHNIAFAGTRLLGTGTTGPFYGILYKTENGGASWYSVHKDIGPRKDWIYSLAISPYPPYGILATTHENGAFYSSQDGDFDTWIEVEANGINLRDGKGRAVAIAPTSGSQPGFLATWGGGFFKSPQVGGRFDQTDPWVTSAYIYPNSLTTAGYSPSMMYMAEYENGFGIIQSSNAGMNWTSTNLRLRNLYSVTAPTQSLVLAGTTVDGVYRSTDGGNSWEPSSQGIRNTHVTGLIFPQPGTAYGSARGSGVYRSTDGGVTWTSFNQGLTDKLINALAWNPAQPGLLYALTETTGLWSINLTNPTQWAQVSQPQTAPAVQVAPSIDPSANPVTDLNEIDGWLRARPEALDDIRAFDPPLEPTEVQLISSATAPLTSLVFAPNSTSAYLGTAGGGVYRSVAGGPFTYAGLRGWSIRSLVVHPSNAQIVYAASNTVGKLHLSTNGGNSWGDLALPANIEVFSLAADPQDPDGLLAGTSSGVWRYSGGAWQQLGLTGTNVRLISTRPSRPSVYFAAAEGATYVSVDNGLHWEPVAPELDGLTVQTIQYNPAEPHFVYFGTVTSGTLRISTVP